MKSKYLLSSLMAAAGFLVFTGMAKASDATVSNSTTGAESHNKASINISSSNTAAINNVANVRNNINVCANTGGNKANMNTGDGSVVTGDASATVSSSTNVNNVSLQGSSSAGGFSANVSNNTAGAKSHNDAKVDVDSPSTLVLNNSANIANNLSTRLNTGENKANMNTGDGAVRSGEANSLLRATTRANMADIAFGGGMSGDITLSNMRTGYDSDNDINANISSGKELYITSEAVINNNFDANVETGDNEASKNTGDGSSRSGDASATTEVTTAVNETRVRQRGGSGSFDVALSNNTTGAQSDNYIRLDLDSGDSVYVDNIADINNDIYAKAETGDNQANMNTGDGAVRSGDASVEATFSTRANLADLNMGSGSGDVMVDATNSHTGYDSDNDIRIDLDSGSELSINNQAQIYNQLDLRALTGYNKANMNTGDGSVVSGDASIDGELNTTANKTSFIGAAMGSGDMDVTASNNITGAKSDNNIKFDLNKENEMDINNAMDACNDGVIVNHTGENKAKENTGDGGILSGDSAVDVTVNTSGGNIGSGAMDGMSSFNDFSTSQDLNGDGQIHVSVDGNDIL